MTLDRHFSELYLVDSLQSLLESAGFSWMADKHQFRRALPEGFQNVIIAISPYDDAVLVEFHFGIRWHALEAIVGTVTRARPAFRADDHSLVVSQGKLLGKQYFRYEARDTDGLDDIVADFCQCWEQLGKEFLANQFSIEAIHRCLNGAPSKPCMYLPNQAHRYLRGIVAAKLAGSPDFDQLAYLYELGLAKEPQGSLLMQDYRLLVEHLADL